MPTPAALKRPLHPELAPGTLGLVEVRGPLDLGLWTLLAADRISAISVKTAQRHAILRTAARQAWLMAA